MSVYCMITLRGEPKHRAISKGRRHKNMNRKKLRTEESLLLKADWMNENEQVML